MQENQLLLIMHKVSKEDFLPSLKRQLWCFIDHEVLWPSRFLFPLTFAYRLQPRLKSMEPDQTEAV